MLDTILGFLQGLKLSLTEWLAVTAAVVIGGLVTALKLQKSQLHKTQVQLIGAGRDARAAQDGKDATALDDYYKKVKAEFEAAGGRLE